MKQDSMNRLIRNFAYEVTLSASESKYFDFQNENSTDDTGQRTDIVVPLKNIQISNTGTTALKFYENNDKAFKFVPAGTIIALTDRQIWGVTLENASSTTANTFTFTIDNDISTEELQRNIYDKMSRGAL